MFSIRHISKVISRKQSGPIVLHGLYVRGVVLSREPRAAKATAEGVAVVGKMGSVPRAAAVV